MAFVTLDKADFEGVDLTTLVRRLFRVNTATGEVVIRSANTTGMALRELTVEELMQMDVAQLLRQVVRVDDVTGELALKTTDTGGGGGGATQLNDLSDVDLDTEPPTNSQVLVYDEAKEVWVPASLDHGGGGARTVFAADLAFASEEAPGLTVIRDDFPEGDISVARIASGHYRFVSASGVFTPGKTQAIAGWRVNGSMFTIEVLTLGNTRTDVFVYTNAGEGGHTLLVDADGKKATILIEVHP